MRKKYLLLTIVLFCIETLIALFVHDNFVRPFVGDIIVVVLLYTFMKIFPINKDVPLIGGIFLFAVFVEFLQYIKIVELLGLSSNKIASTVIGTSFDWKDILAYGIGAALLFLFVTIKKRGDAL